MREPAFRAIEVGAEDWEPLLLGNRMVVAFAYEAGRRAVAVWEAVPGAMEKLGLETRADVADVLATVLNDWYAATLDDEILESALEGGGDAENSVVDSRGPGGGRGVVGVLCDAAGIGRGV
jgi:hypothetical protein